MKEKTTVIISLIILLFAYLLFRYCLLYLHGMKQFSFMLCVISAMIIIVTGLFKSSKIIPLATTLAYIMGFVFANLFDQDYGMGLNNMWILWIGCYVVIVFIGIIANWKKKVKTKG